MNMFIDTEFTCLPWEGSSELISIGVVLEDGSEYYGCSSEFDCEGTSEFVKNNVLKHLPENQSRKSLQSIGKDIDEFIGHKEIGSVWAVFPTFQQIENLCRGSKPASDIHREFADWDFQLLQRLSVASEKMPSFCNDLSLIIGKHESSVLPTNKNAHNALEDARWNFEVWKNFA